MNKFLSVVIFFSLLLYPTASEAVNVYGEKALHSIDEQSATELLDALQVLYEEIDNAAYENRKPDKTISYLVLKRICSTNIERITSLYHFIKLNDSIINIKNISNEVLDELDKYLTSNAVVIDKALGKDIIFINKVIDTKEKDLTLQYRNDLRILLNDFSELIHKTVKF
ncbi:MAG: hypothetical protein SVS15_01950 [Thermodesulfobacteriota bacterium]|nr:hypothetical protein [Thermodesulfobacteriota bacterium]